MSWTENIGKALEWPGKFVANGAHAQQDIPSQHRTLNAMGMFAGWWAFDQLRNIAFGLKQKSEGEYVEMKAEQVPAPLRFLHKTIDWDPHSDSPEHQWKKLLYQMTPAVGGAIMAIAGSTYAYNRSGRAQGNKALELKGLDKLNLLEMDYHAQYAQSVPMRALAGFFATFSAASGLTFLYGVALTSAFASANGGKIFNAYGGSLTRGKFAPHRAVDEELGMVGSYVKEAMKTGKVPEEWAKTFELRVLEPLFGELKEPEAKAKAVKTLQGIVESSYQKFKASGAKPEDIAKSVQDDLTKMLGKTGLDKTLKEKFGLDPKKATPGNANSAINQFQSFLASLGLVKSHPVGAAAETSMSDSHHELAVLGGTAAAVGGAMMFSSKPASAKETLGSAEDHAVPNDLAVDADTTPTRIDTEHPRPDFTGKTARQYVDEAQAMHRAQYNRQGVAPPALLQWIGNAELAVLPKNRLSCAVGITTGLLIAGNMAKIATGYGLDKKPIDASKIPTFLQWMKGIVKDYNPHGLRPRDRWINYAQWAVYSLGGFMGAKIGTDYAYSNVASNNKDPHYLEDYLPRVSMHQGENWSWLSAFGGMFASSAGLFTLPVPGLNYGLSLAGRTTSMQDRNFMLPGGLGKLMSGSETTSFLRLREGLNYMSHYAVGNPDRDPEQFEFLAYTMLAPLFKEKLTAEHIQQFTSAVHQVRDQYWQEGGIPKAKRKEALKTMREVFNGPGLEVLLLDMGLNPGTIDFESLNGLTGALGNIGVHQKIRTEQEAYHTAFSARLDTYVKEGLITQEKADWARGGMEALRKPSVITARATPESEIQERQNAIRRLIDKADNKGDWRDGVRLRREKEVPMAMGG